MAEKNTGSQLAGEVSESLRMTRSEAAFASQALSQALVESSARMRMANKASAERMSILAELAGVARDAAAAERELSAAGGRFGHAQLSGSSADRNRAPSVVEPGTDLLQRASQVKDAVDLATPAAKAMIELASRLPIPLNAAAAGIGVLSAAYLGGAQESREYARTLIMTGDAAGVSADQMQDMARRVGNNVGTQREAAEAINLLALKTNLGAAGFELAAAAAVRWNRATGTSIGEVVSAFGEIANAPLAATVRLNEGMNFLTASTYEQISALMQQGRSAEAADIAQRAYADALMERAPKLDQQLGTLERAWERIRSTARGAWDEMLNLGRDKTLEEQIVAQSATVQALDNTYQQQLRRGRATGNLGAKLQAAVEVQEALERDYYARLGSESKGVTQQKELRQSVYRADYLSDSRRTTESQQRAREIADEEVAFRKALEGLKKDTKEYEDVYAAHLMALKRINERFARRRSFPVAAPVQADLQPKAIPSAGSPEPSKRSALDEAMQSIADYRGLRAGAFETQIGGVGLSANERATRESTGQVLGRYQQIRNSYTEKTEKEGGAEALHSSDYRDGMFEIDSAMQSQLAREQEYAQARIAIQQDWKLGATQAFGEWVESSSSLMEQSKGVVSSVFTGMTDLVTNFVMTGKAKFSDFARSVLADMAKIAARQAMIGLVTTVAGALMGTASGAAYGTEALATQVGESGGDAIGSLISSNGIGRMNAKGAVYSSHSLSAYSNGIYDSPQFFEFAKGAGVFAEAGPEAILPLKRASDGSLGVRAEVPKWAPPPVSGSSEVNVITSIQVMGDGSANETKSTSSNESVRQLGDMISSQTKAIIARELRPGGLIYNFGNRG